MPITRNEPRCDGACLTGWDLGVPSDAVAYPDPMCSLHGDPAGDPLSPEEEEVVAALHPDYIHEMAQRLLAQGYL